MNYKNLTIYGPFVQAITLEDLPDKGAIAMEAIVPIKNAGILVDEKGKVVECGIYSHLVDSYYASAPKIKSMHPQVVLPGFIDSHTHICFAGSRANDFEMRNSGKSYLDIAASGGGIWSSVQHVRNATEEQLVQNLNENIKNCISQGITCIEVKSGYGLSVVEEVKMLRAIKKAQENCPIKIVPTCLAAHLKPKDFDGSNAEYLTYIVNELLPIIKEENLSDRIDIFIEKSAFSPEEGLNYVLQAKNLGFKITVHADQFTPGGSRVAVEVGALSADHLEASGEEEIQVLATSETVATALPGASLGLGESFTPARKLLDAGACLAIASDWNPGSAPMGQLLTQASILATYEKLNAAEVFSGLCFRAAKALDIKNKGKLSAGFDADFQVYDVEDYREILYHQGSIRPTQVYSKGISLV